MRISVNGLRGCKRSFAVKLGSGANRARIKYINRVDTRCFAARDDTALGRIYLQRTKVCPRRNTRDYPEVSASSKVLPCSVRNSRYHLPIRLCALVGIAFGFSVSTVKVEPLYCEDEDVSDEDIETGAVTAGTKPRPSGIRFFTSTGLDASVTYRQTAVKRPCSPHYG